MSKWYEKKWWSDPDVLFTIMVCVLFTITVCVIAVCVATYHIIKVLFPNGIQPQ